MNADNSSIFIFSTSQLLEACTSGYIKNGQCYPALKSVVKGRPCTSDSECLAKDKHLGQVVQYGTCTCGYNGGINYKW